jgi:hypothetical protein
MALPASFLNQVEHHSCFSGCYGSELDARVCLDAARPPEPAIFISCRDCLTYKAGVLRGLLPPGISSDALADQVTQHMRAVRGFDLSFGGYHMRGGGFWLNAAYYDRCGLFLIDGARSRATGSDLDLLVLAFRQGVAQPPDPRMTDPKLYQTQVVYVDFTVPVLPVGSKQDLLSSAQCRLHPATGFHRVTLAEFQPLAAVTVPGTASAQAVLSAGSAGPGAPGQAAQQSVSSIGLTGAGTVAAGAAPAAVAAPGTGGATGGLAGTTGAAAAVASAMAAAGSARRLRPAKLRLGDTCPVCQAELRERPLFTGTFIGCLC